MNLPSFQFYPGDWLRDNVSGCTLSAQGLWLRLMVVMHDSERYGYLCQNGIATPPDVLARKCGATLAEYNSLLDELFAAGVPSRTSDGIIYSRRMVRDAEKRTRDAERQRKKYAKDADVKTSREPHGDLTPTSREPHTSSSSSSSSSKKETTTTTTTEPPVTAKDAVTDPPEGESLNRKKRFIPPSLEEVASYLKASGKDNSVDAEAFHAFYESKGWLVGRVPMKSWKAAVVTWQKNGFSTPKRQEAPHWSEIQLPSMTK